MSIASVEPLVQRAPPTDGAVALPAAKVSRRTLLFRLCGGGLLAGGATAAYARYVEPFWPVTERHDMDFRRLDRRLHGLKVLQLSDLHLSNSVPVDYLRAQIEHCATLQPDLILLTGDYITAGNASWLDALGRLVRRLQAPLGVVAVLGNHDYGVYAPRRRPRGRALGDYMHAGLEAAGVTVLRNQVHTVACAGAPLQLVGVDDLWGGFCDPAAAFEDADPAQPTIVLTHNPDTIPLLEGRRYDWLLCGHTHGGQVRIPLLGAPLLPVENRQWDAGLFEVGDHWVYVNRGLGSLHQVRFSCRPEITLFTLTDRA